MRNLALRSDASSRLQPAGEPAVEHFCAAAERGDAFFLRGPCTVCCSGERCWQVDLSATTPDVAHTRATSLAFSPELDALSITTAAGHLLLLDANTQGVEEVGLIDGGVLAAAWSPEGEVLALVSGGGVLLLFTKAFEVLAEQQLHSQPELVVPARALPPQEPGPSAAAACIAWRGDGRFLATVSHASPGGEGGVLRVWERDGCRIHAIGEAVPGLSGPLAWQPNGRHIYAAQQQAGGGQAVVLFERNGLSHGSFPCSAQGEVRRLAWSADSQLLAVQLSLPGSGCEAVQLWLRSNWHWYLKQELRFPGATRLSLQWSEEGPASLAVCTGDGVLRQVALGTSACVSGLGTAAVVDGCRLLITPLRRRLVPPPLAAVAAACPAPVQCVAFLDGCGAEVLAAALADGSLVLLPAVEEDLWEETLEEAGEAGGAPPEALVPTAVCCAGPGLSQLQHVRCLAWTGPSTLLAAGALAQLDTSGGSSGGDALIELELAQPGPSVGRARVAAACRAPVAAPEPVLALVSAPGGGALLQLARGRLLAYAAGGRLAEAQGFPKPCPQMLAVPPASLQGGAAPAVGLSADGEVFWGRQRVAAGATSMALRTGAAAAPDCLLHTSRDRLLHTRALAALAAADGERPKLASGGDGSGAAPPAVGLLEARAVEAGALLVAAPPGGVAAVLQMPRGNLEAVHPRALVLPAVAAAVQAGAWAEAWELATTHRADLNLLVDYGWPSFLAAAPEFLRQVPDDQDVGDLLSALRPDSVTAPGGIYAGLPPVRLPPPQEAAGDSPRDKVAAVCGALRAAMQAAGAAGYLKPLATSHAVVGEVEQALLLVKAAKEAQLAREAGSSPAGAGGEVVMGQGALGRHRRLQARAPPTAEDALRHLLLTTEVEQLYRAALGMYELELAYMVVAHSQRDPGEYLLELQRFAAQPAGPLRRHAVNAHLRRTSAAIADLLAAGPAHFGAAVQLARREGKLRELLALLGDSPGVQQQRRTVLAEHAAWLAERSRLEDAALAFLAAGQPREALEQYREGGHWQMALAVAGRLAQGEGEVRGLAEGLLEGLVAAGRLAEAARLATEHLRDADTGVQLLCSAREWREALRVAALFGRQDLVETTVAPAAAEAAATLLEELGGSRERVGKYESRLRAVRERAAAAAAAGEGSEPEDGVFEGREADDGASDGGSSVVSGLSAYTQASGAAPSTASSSARPPSTAGGRWPQKRGKRRARKGPRIRQGSPEEEAALAAHLASLAPSPQACAEAGQLAELLVLLGHEADARALQAALSALVSLQAAAAAYARSQPAGATLPEAGTAAPAPAAPSDWKWDILRPAGPTDER